MKNRKDLMQLMREAEDQGWTVSKTNGGHLRWLSPQGITVFSSYSAGDHRTLKNTKSQLKAAGFVEFVKKGRRRK